jgi:hypothetical protein
MRDFMDLSEQIDTFQAAINADRMARRAQGSGNQNQAKWVATDDTGVPNFAVEGEDTNFASMRCPLPENQKLVQNTASSSPAFLVEYLDFYHEEVCKLLGVPPGLLGSARSPVAVNQTILNVWFSTLSDYRVLLQGVIEDVFVHYYGGKNAAHAMTKADHSKSVAQNYKKHKITVTLPGVLDPEIINMLRDRGHMTHAVVSKYISRYYGIPMENLTKERIDPMTDEPVAVEEEEEEEAPPQAKAAEDGGSSAAAVQAKRPASAIPPKKKRKTAFANQRDRGDQ